MNQKKQIEEIVKLLESMPNNEKENTSVFLFSIMPLIESNALTMAKANSIISGDAILLGNALFDEIFNKPEYKIFKKIFIHRLLKEMESDQNFMQFINQSKNN